MRSSRGSGALTRLALAALLACAMHIAAAAGEPPVAARATLFLDANGTPTVRYALGPDESRIRFAAREERTDALARARFWTFDAACFALERGALRRLDPACDEPEVKLDWDTVERDRVSPGLVRLRNGGVLVYTAYIQPLTADESALAPWLVQAPPGGIAAFQSTKSPGALAIDPAAFALNLAGWVYLGPDRFVETSAARVLVDDGIAPVLADEMVGTPPRLIDAYAHALDAPPSRRPTLYLTWSDREGAQRSFQANVVPAGVMRFTLSGARWADPAPESLAIFRSVMAHEFAHWWNADIFLPMPWAASWLAEGGAELLGTGSLLATGALDPQAAAERVDGAFNECALMAAGRAWRDIPERNGGRYPYACGMALQFAVLALARAGGEPVDAFGLWKNVWAATPRYYEASLQQFLERRGQHDAARALQELLTGGSTGVALAMRRIFEHAGLRTLDDARLPPHLRAAIARQAMVAIMQSDCGGNASFYELPDAVQVAPMQGCAHFRPGMVVRALEGVDLLREPLAATARARSACHERMRLRVATLEGQELALACSDAMVLPNPGALLRLDPAQVAPLLWRGD